MTVVVHCKRCGKELRAKDCYAGMPTRCPRCETINQLPSLPPAPPPKKAASGEKPRPKTDPVGRETPSDACKICGKPIRGKAERFTDVHGTAYHLRCYQEQVGSTPEDACRICHQGFRTARERVKDVLGFYYHRKCYQEELERQKLADRPNQPNADSSPSVNERPAALSETKSSPGPPEDDDWDLTPETGDDWNLDGEVDDGWMRPDPDDLELKEEKEEMETPTPFPASEPVVGPPKETVRPADPKPSRPAPGSAKTAAPSASRKEPAGATPTQPSKTPADLKSSRPAAPPATAAPKSEKPRKSKPLPRAKPIQEQPAAAAALPEGLELLPDEPVRLPDGLELLPGPPQDDVIEGLEILEDGPAIPMAKTVANPLTSSAPPPAAPIAYPDASFLDETNPLGGPVPVAAPFQPSHVDPFGLPSASASPFDSPDLAYPAATGPTMPNTDNAIPRWLWAVMGLGVGVVVIMLMASVINVILDSGKKNEPVARSESPGGEEEDSSPWEGDEDYSDDDWQPTGPRNHRPEGGLPPDSLLARYREFRAKSKNTGGAYWAGFLLGTGIGLAVYLGISALALRLACKICGESDAADLRIVGICIAQLLAGVLFNLATATLSSATASIINFPIACAVSVALVRFMLPTSIGRAVGIAICHVIMCAVVAFVLIVIVILMLLAAIGSMS